MKNILTYCFTILAASNLFAQVTSFPKNQLPARFQGDMSQWIAVHTIYPSEIKDTTLHGTVYISFKIEQDGSLSDISLVKGISGGDALNDDALHIISQMPKWTPASENGVAVRSHYITVPVYFKVVNGSSNGCDTSYARNDDGSILTMVQVKPKFKGDIYQWLSDHLNYPKKAKNKNIQGTVFVSFIVERDGSVTGAHVLRGVDDLLNDEALRVVSSMPQWIPGAQNGHPVRVQYMLPIHFVLN